jgi:hypothetical protein
VRRSADAVLLRQSLVSLDRDPHGLDQSFVSTVNDSCAGSLLS